MIESITLTNFQRHTKLHLDLQPGVNVIVGDSDAGKSSIIRALRWACLGGPATGLRGWGQETVRVALGIDSVRLVRFRTPDRNGYKLDGKVFEAVGTQVPDEVSRFLNVSDLHFQGQMDAPFLLGATSLESARLLNRVISLDLIDSTLSNLDSEVRRSKSSLMHKANEVRECEGDLARTDWVIAARKTLDLATELEAELLSLGSEITDLVDYQKRLQACPLPRYDLDLAEGYRERLDELEQASSEMRSLRTHLSVVEEAEARLCSTITSLREAEAQLHTFRAARCPLCGAEPSC